MSDPSGRRRSQSAALLRDRVSDPGFTPSVREVPGLIELLTDDESTKAAERALARVGAPAVALLGAEFAGSRPPLRGRLVRAIGRLAQDGNSAAAQLLLAALADDDPKTQRNAAIALGHVPGPESERALRDAWSRSTRVEMRRSIAAALGKIGGEGALGLLGEAVRDPDPELARIADRATRMVSRTASRPGRGRIDGARASKTPQRILALCRSGLETLLEGELLRLSAVSEPKVAGPGRVAAVLGGRIGDLLAARTMLGFRFPLPREALAVGEAVPYGVARALASEPARRIFEAFTEGPVRYRLAWAHGGHKRALTWDTARVIGESSPECINDPTESIWEVLVATSAVDVNVALVPRALADPRFSYRVGDVPAASHPTIAAALARVAGAHADDVVWDPFVGSGGELVERGLLGPFRALLGSDSEERALAVARGNLAAAGMEVDLRLGDALTLHPPGVRLIITNPPMGRRASRGPGLARMLDSFVAHAAEVLRPGGRLVWVTPWGERARGAGQGAGLSLDWARPIDMGGFDAELQRWLKPRG